MRPALQRRRPGDADRQHSRLTPANNYIVGRAEAQSPARIRGSAPSGRTAIRQSQGDYNRVYGADAHFQFYDDRLEFDGYLLRSDTPGNPDREPGAALSDRVERRRAHDNRRNTTRCSRTSIPEVGFVRRGDISHYAGELTWAPRVEHPTIQNLTFGTNVDYYNRASLDCDRDARPGGERRHPASGTTGRPTSPSPGRSTGCSSPSTSGTTSRFRPAITNTRTTSTNFNIGQRPPDHRQRELQLGRVLGRAEQVLVRRDRAGGRYHFSFDGNYSRNQVTLPGGPFTTNLVGRADSSTRLHHAPSSTHSFSTTADTKQ